MQHNGPKTRTGFRLDDGQIEVVAKALWPILRKLSPAQKIAQVNEMYRMAKMALNGQIRRLHPDWSDKQVAAEVSRRLLRGTS